MDYVAKKIPAGWYPLDNGTQRYWDGTKWTEHIAPGTGQASTSDAAAGADPADAPVAPTDDAEVNEPDALAAPSDDAPATASPEPSAAAAPATIATPPAAPSGTAPSATAAGTDARPLYKKKRFALPVIGCGGLLFLFILIGVIAAAASSGDKDDDAAPRRWRPRRPARPHPPIPNHSRCPMWWA